MVWSDIVSFGFQTVITVIIGACAWGIKNAINELKSKTMQNAADIKELRGELSDLKSDLPLIYTLREDHIRVMNNVERKLDRLLSEKKE